MSKLSSLAVAAAGLAFAVPILVVPTPALAQNGTISEIIVYGTDPCPRSTDDEVVVCARKPEGERYRIPEKLRSGGSFQSKQSWANRATQFETYGRTGINACSPVGPGGFTGCSDKLIKEAFKERKAEVDANTAPDQ